MCFSVEADKTSICVAAPVQRLEARSRFAYKMLRLGRSVKKLDGLHPPRESLCGFSACRLKNNHSARHAMHGLGLPMWKFAANSQLAYYDTSSGFLLLAVEETHAPEGASCGALPVYVGIYLSIYMSVANGDTLDGICNTRCMRVPLPAFALLKKHSDLRTKQRVCSP